MKKSKLFLIPFILFASSIIISSCGNKASAEASAATAASDPKAKEFANNMCKMAEEIGLDANFKLTEEYLEKKEDKFEDNALNNSNDLIKLLKQVDKHMGGLNNNQKTAVFESIYYVLDFGFPLHLRLHLYISFSLHSLKILLFPNVNLL